MTDEFSYLREKEKAIDYFKEQNKIADEFLSDQHELMYELFNEIKGRLTDYESFPLKKGDYYYFYRDYKEKPYKIFYRKKEGEEEEEEVILDGNRLAAGSTSLLLSDISISEDHKLIAYLYSLDGSDRQTLEIKNLQTGEILLRKEDAADVEWFGEEFYFLRVDDTLRPYRLYKGNLKGSEEFIYEEQKPEAFLCLSKSRNEKKIYLYSKTMESNEARIIDGSGMRVFAKRKEKVDYYLENWHDKTVILSNFESKDFRLYIEEEDSWQEIYRPQKGKLEDVEVFKNRMVVVERFVSPKLKIIEPENLNVNEVQLAEGVYEIEGIAAGEFDTQEVGVKISSIVTPEKVYLLNLKTLETKLAKKHNVPGLKPEDYEIKREYAGDVPVTVCYKREFSDSKKALLTGYGSYGVVYPVCFSNSIISLLDRGFKYCIAHVRGGCEKGHEWYEEGKFLKKKNTFYDFLRASEYLIEKGYTSKKSLAISGGSAGGLLVGAVINTSPGLYKAAVADVPFVDVLNTMLDPSLPLTTMEYEEWGNPNEKEYYDYIKSYSPYENISEQHYPDILITTSINDTRVGYWEPAKWHAKLKKHSLNPNIFIKTNFSAGHAGFTSKDEAIKEDVCYKFAFLIKCLDCLD
ncbi:MAG: prolyl oligopeptidase family serine peptidase [Nanoarchaeota archaeon]